jgi:hypothetical protein
LTTYGYDVRDCANAFAGGMCSGLHIAKLWQPHLIICDEKLVDGVPAWKFAYEFLNFVEFTQAPRPYLVCLTAHATTREKRLCEECGFDVYHKKPIELTTLLGWGQKAKEFCGVTFDSTKEYKKEDKEEGEEAMS